MFLRCKAVLDTLAAAAATNVSSNDPNATVSVPAAAVSELKAVFTSLTEDDHMLQNTDGPSASSAAALATLLAHARRSASEALDFVNRNAIAVVPPTRHVRDAAEDAVAIVGMSCELANGMTTLDDYWRFLVSNGDAITEVPPERWDPAAWWDPDPEAPQKTYSKWGSFCRTCNDFDATLFGFKNQEAASLDPSQKLLLTCTYRAFENGGIPLESVNGQPVGVYVGIMNMDPITFTAITAENVTGYSATSNSACICSNRLSYFLNVNGPSFTVDTACSSFSVCLHQAITAIKCGEVPMAVVGAANICWAPTMYIVLSKARMLSPTGHCYAFSNKADGYVRGEGASVVVLRPLREAIASGNRIHGVILGSGVNQDGRATTTITAPSWERQSALVKGCLNTAKVPPAAIHYAELHGTGTPRGDPVETKAVGTTLRVGREGKVLIGSVKSQIGHLEAAAGGVALVKLCMSMQNDLIPASIWYTPDTGNPDIEFDDWQIEVVTENRPWPTRDGERKLAVQNSFGFGGTNASVVLAEPERGVTDPEMQAAADAAAVGLCRGTPDTEVVVAVSAATPTAAIATLRATATALTEIADRDGEEAAATVFARVAATSCLRRTLTHRFRVAVPAGSVSDFSVRVAAAAAPKVAPRSVRVVFAFCGQGSQWQGMGSVMAKECSVYRRTWAKLDALLRPHMNLSLDDLMASEDLHATIKVQPAIFAVQVALFESWKAHGVVPAAVVGHSVGEVAAAYAAGWVSLEDAVKIVVARSRAQSRVTSGGMVAVRNVDRPAIEQMMREYGLEMAASNAPTVYTLAGDVDKVAALAAAMPDRAKQLEVSAAFHSSHMNPSEAPLRATFPPIPLPRAGAQLIPLFSTVSGAKAVPGSGEFISAEYWWHNVRGEVKFAEGVAAAVADVPTDTRVVVVEIGPIPALRGAIAESLNVAGYTANSVHPSMLRGTARARFLKTVCELFGVGVKVDFTPVYERFDTVATYPHAMPIYAMERPPHWWLPDSIANQHAGGYRTGGGAEHQLLQRMSSSASPADGDAAAAGEVQVVKAQSPAEPFAASSAVTRFRATFDKKSASHVFDHFAGQRVLVPGAMYAELGLSAARTVSRESGAPSRFALSCVFQQTLTIPDGGSETVRVTLTRKDGSAVVAAERVHLASPQTPSASPTTGAAEPFGETAHPVEYDFVVTSGDSDRTVHARGSVLASDRAVPRVAYHPLSQLRGMCTKAEWTAADFYGRLLGIGFRYGPRMSPVQRVCLGDRAVAFADLELHPDVVREVPMYGVHPSLLDACLQLGISTAGSAGSTLFPYGIDRLVANGPFTRKMHAFIARGADRPRPDGPADIMVNLLLFDENGVAVLEIGGAAFRQVAGSGPANNDQIAYVASWRPLPNSSAVGVVCGASPYPMDALQMPLRPGFARSYTDVAIATAPPPPPECVARELRDLDTIDTLAVVYFAETLGVLGAPLLPAGSTVDINAIIKRVDSEHKHTIPPHLQKMLHCMGAHLARRGALQPTANGVYKSTEAARGLLRLPSEEVSTATTAAIAATSGIVKRLVDVCGQQLPAIMQGKTDPLQLLFPSGKSLSDLDAIYTDVYTARYAFNTIGRVLFSAIAAAAAKVPHGSVIRILELGAGTGGLTKKVFPIVAAAARCAGVTLEYVFSDVSAGFVENAQRLFADASEMEFAVCDIEQPPPVVDTSASGPSLVAGSFDFVVAANVIHATIDLTTTLTHVRRLLAPGGSVLVFENAPDLPFSDMIFGLLSGWWRFVDTQWRANHCCVTRRTWTRMSEAAGFARTAFLPIATSAGLSSSVGSSVEEEACGSAAVELPSTIATAYANRFSVVIATTPPSAAPPMLGYGMGSHRPTVVLLAARGAFVNKFQRCISTSSRTIYIEDFTPAALRETILSLSGGESTVDAIVCTWHINADVDAAAAGEPCDEDAVVERGFSHTTVRSHELCRAYAQLDPSGLDAPQVEDEDGRVLVAVATDGSLAPLDEPPPPLLFVTVCAAPAPNMGGDSEYDDIMAPALVALPPRRARRAAWQDHAPLRGAAACAVGSSVWGMARSINREPRGAHIRCVDIDAPTPLSARAVAQSVLLHVGTYSEFSVVDGKVNVSAVVPVPLPAYAKRPIPADDVENWALLAEPLFPPATATPADVHTLAHHTGTPAPAGPHKLAAVATAWPAVGRGKVVVLLREMALADPAMWGAAAKTDVHGGSDGTVASCDAGDALPEGFIGASDDRARHAAVAVAAVGEVMAHGDDVVGIARGALVLVLGQFPAGRAACVPVGWVTLLDRLEPRRDSHEQTFTMEFVPPQVPRAPCTLRRVPRHELEWREGHATALAAVPHLHTAWWVLRKRMGVRARERVLLVSGGPSAAAAGLTVACSIVAASSCDADVRTVDSLATAAAIPPDLLAFGSMVTDMSLMSAMSVVSTSDVAGLGGGAGSLRTRPWPVDVFVFVGAAAYNAAVASGVMVALASDSARCRAVVVETAMCHREVPGAAPLAAAVRTDGQAVPVEVVRVADAFSTVAIEEALPYLMRWVCGVAGMLHEHGAVRVRDLSKHAGRAVAARELHGGSGGMIPLVVRQAPNGPLVAAVQPSLSAHLHSRAYAFVVGGYTGLGLQTVAWLTRMGIRHVAILSRRQPSADVVAQVKAALAPAVRSSVRFLFLSGSVSDSGDVAAAFAAVDRKWPGLRLAAVFNSALILQDGLIVSMSNKAFIDVAQPKVLGSWWLHREATARDCQYFTSYSSVAGFAGNWGQSNYSAGNAFQDALAVLREARGLPGTATAWGALALGALAGDSPEVEMRRRRILSFGLDLLSVDEILGALEGALLSRVPSMLLCRFAFETFFESLQRSAAPGTSVTDDFRLARLMRLFLSHQRLSGSGLIEFGDAPGAAGGVGALALVAQNPAGPARQQALEALVIEVVAETLKADNAERGSLLTDLGVDSLTAVQLRTVITRTFSVDIPLVDILAAEATPSRLATALNEKIDWAAAEATAGDADGASGAAAAGGAGGAAVAPKKSSRGHVELSSQQRAIFIQQYVAPETYDFNIGAVLRIDNDGITIPRVVWAGKMLIERWDVLRTLPRFDADGRVVAVLKKPFAIPVTDLSEEVLAEARLAGLTDDPAAFAAHITDRLRGAQSFAFDLVRDSPLRFVAVDARSTLGAVFLAITVHHFVADFASMGHIASDIRALLTASMECVDEAGAPIPGAPAPQLAPMPALSYAHYVAMQAETLRTRGHALSQWWKAHIPTLPEPLPLPSSVRGGPAAVTTGAMASPYGKVEIPFGPRLSPALTQLAQSNGTSVFSLVVAAHAYVISKLSGVSRVVLATPADVHLSYSPELAGVIGCFADVVPLVCDVDPTVPFTKYLASVNTNAASSLEHAELPSVDLIRALNWTDAITRGAVIEHHVLMWDHKRFAQLAFDGLLWYGQVGIESDTRLLVEQREGGALGVSLEYKTKLYTRTDAIALLVYLHSLLVAITADPSRPLGSHEMMSVADVTAYTEATCPRRGVRPSPLALVPPTTGADLVHPESGDVLRGFVNAANLLPTAPAFALGRLMATYGSVAACVVATSRAILEAARGNTSPSSPSAVNLADTFVAIYAPRFELGAYIGILAAVYSGAAYVYIDTTTPTARVRDILSDCRPRCIVGSPPAEVAGIPTVPLYTSEEVAAAFPLSRVPPAASVSPSSAAYCIFTSGSSGRPKGVVIERQTLANLVVAEVNYFGYRASDVFYQFASPAFDVCVEDLFCSMNVGACVAVPQDILSLIGVDLSAAIDAHSVTVIEAVPSVLATLPNHRAGTRGTVRVINGGGEVFSSSLQRSLAAANPGATVFNTYGPTETTVTTHAAAFDPTQPTTKPSIGTPFPHVKCYVVRDDSGAPQLPGVPGELWIGGDTLARGYLNDPAKTAASFITLTPTPETAGRDDRPLGRVYKTGDLAVYTRSGDLIIVGRKDAQVKVAGNRLELEEVDTAATAAGFGPGSATVSPDGQRLLLAIEAPKDTAVIDVGAVQRGVLKHLRSTLPSYMVPHTVYALPPGERVPRLAASGKLDRKALADLLTRKHALWSNPTAIVSPALSAATLAGTTAAPLSHLGRGAQGPLGSLPVSPTSTQPVGAVPTLVPSVGGGEVTVSGKALLGMGSLAVEDPGVVAVGGNSSTTHSDEALTDDVNQRTDVLPLTPSTDAVPVAPAGAARRAATSHRTATAPSDAVTAAQQPPAQLPQAYDVDAGLDPVEARLALIFRAVLSLPPTQSIAADESFFALGGTSILAAQLVQAVRGEVGYGMSLRTLFESPSVGALATKMKASPDLFDSDEQANKFLSTRRAVQPVALAGAPVSAAAVRAALAGGAMSSSARPTAATAAAAAPPRPDPYAAYPANNNTTAHGLPPARRPTSSATRITMPPPPPPYAPRAEDVDPGFDLEEAFGGVLKSRGIEAAMEDGHLIGEGLGLGLGGDRAAHVAAAGGARFGDTPGAVEPAGCSVGSFGDVDDDDLFLGEDTVVDCHTHARYPNEQTVVATDPFSAVGPPAGCGEDASPSRGGVGGGHPLPDVADIARPTAASKPSDGLVLWYAILQTVIAYLAMLCVGALGIPCIVLAVYLYYYGDAVTWCYDCHPWGGTGGGLVFWVFALSPFIITAFGGMLCIFSGIVNVVFSPSAQHTHARSLASARHWIAHTTFCSVRDLFAFAVIGTQWWNLYLWFHGVRLRPFGRNAPVIFASEIHGGGLVSIADGAHIDGGAVVSAATTLPDGSVVFAPVTIGRNANIGRKVVVQAGAVIGDNATLLPGTAIPAGFAVAAGATIGGAAPAPAEDPRGAALEKEAQMARRSFGGVGWVLAAIAHLLGAVLVWFFAVYSIVTPFAFTQSQAEGNQDPRVVVNLMFSERLLFLAPMAGLSSLWLVVSIAACILRVFLLLRWRSHPGTYPLRSAYGIRLWVWGRLQVLCAKLCRPMMDTVWWKAFALLMGGSVNISAEVVMGSEDAMLDQVHVGSHAVVGTHVNLGAPIIHRGCMTVGKVVIEPGAALLRPCIVEPNTTIGTAAMVSSQTVVSFGSTIAPKSVAFGCPIMLAGGGAPAADAVDPPRGLGGYVGTLIRFVFDTFCIIVGLYVFTGILWVVFWVSHASYFNLPYWATWLLFPFLAALYPFIAFVLAAVLKWVLILRYSPGARPLVGHWFYRHIFVNRILAIAVDYFFYYLRGSYLVALAFQILGAKVGYGATLWTTTIDSFDGIHIGRYATLGPDVIISGHWITMQRLFQVAPLRIAPRAVVQTNAIVLPATNIDDCAEVAANALVMRGEHLAAGTRWWGSPVERMPRNARTRVLGS